VLWWKGRRELRLPAQVAEQQGLLQQVEADLAAAQAEFERFKEELNRLAERARQLLHGLRAGIRPASDVLRGLAGVKAAADPAGHDKAQ
jgi:hypothetical protein